jgi:hypothetical protein
MEKRMEALRVLASEIYGRSPHERLTWPEECAAADVCRREKFEEEIELIKSKWRETRWFPSTLYGLLEKWQNVLDRIRFRGNGEVSPVDRLKVLDRLIAEHPGRPDAPGKRTEEAVEEYKRLKTERRNLMRQIALG